MTLLVDANQSWDYKTARATLRRWEDRFDLFWAEEPLRADDLINLQRLTEEVSIRIATGETFFGHAELAQIVERRAADVLTINPQKIGGITAFRRLAAAARLNGVAVTCHTFVEVAANLLVETPDAPAIEIVPWMLGVFANAPQVSDGRVQVPEAPGLGLALSDRAETWTTHHVAIAVDESRG